MAVLFQKMAIDLPKNHFVEKKNDFGGSTGLRGVFPVKGEVVTKPDLLKNFSLFFLLARKN